MTPRTIIITIATATGFIKKTGLLLLLLGIVKLDVCSIFSELIKKNYFFSKFETISFCYK